MLPKGVLIPIGGNEDKGEEDNEKYTVEFIQESILSHIVREAGGPKAKILIIPTASSIPIEVSENYLRSFSQLGCTNLKVIDIQTRKQSDSDDVIKAFQTADCIMFSGGDQSRIVRFIGNTEAHRILMERYQNERLVIAGTSAGAMAMSKEMIAGGSSKEALLKGAIKMKSGLCLVEGLIIDTHFIRRGRFSRMAEALATHPSLIGVGLAEDTGIIIENGNQFKVIGSGMVILFDPSKMTHNNYDILEVGTPISIGNMVVHVLATGDEFTINDRKVKVLPLEGNFI